VGYFRGSRNWVLETTVYYLPDEGFQWDDDVLKPPLARVGTIRALLITRLLADCIEDRLVTHQSGSGIATQMSL
jgi:hypothetical protein